MDACPVYSLRSRNGDCLMADIVSPDQRSRNMSAIHSKNTAPERYLRRLLYVEGCRYRIADKSQPGHPDIFLQKYDTAIFVHGCFWHRHKGCKYAYIPKSHIEFWERKFAQNVERDALVRRELERKGIKCLIVWECTIRRMQKDATIERAFLKKILGFLCESKLYMEL